RRSSRLFPQHAPIRLIYSVSANAKIANWFPEMRGEVLLPGLTIANLMALRKAITISIDTAGVASEVDDSPLAGAPEAEDCPRTIHAVMQDAVLKQITKLGIELRPVFLRLVQENRNFLARVCEFVQKISDRERSCLRYALRSQ